jgi:hypothetical protein
MVSRVGVRSQDSRWLLRLLRSKRYEKRYENATDFPASSQSLRSFRTIERYKLFVRLKKHCIMVKTQYESIEDQELGSSPVSETSPRNNTSKRTLVASVLIISALLLVVGLTSQSGFPRGGVPLLGMGHPRACSFEECFATNCNAEVAPYTCLFNNGGPHGGCSPTPWIKGTCTESCDLKDCGSIEIPDDVASCEKKQCEKEWCEGGQVCHTDTMYQCTDGAARFGCSTDALHWTLKTDGTTCSKCCDTTTC